MKQIVEMLLYFSAICDGKTNLTGACETIYQKKDCQITRTETICNSGGNCSSPDVCSNCKHGFYSDGPYCRSKYFLVIVSTVSMNFI